LVKYRWRGRGHDKSPHRGTSQHTKTRKRYRVDAVTDFCRTAFSVRAPPPHNGSCRHPCVASCTLRRSIWYTTAAIGRRRNSTRHRPDAETKDETPALHGGAEVAPLGGARWSPRAKRVCGVGTTARRRGQKRQRENQECRVRLGGAALGARATNGAVYYNMYYNIHYTGTRGDIYYIRYRYIQYCIMYSIMRERSVLLLHILYY